MISVGNISAKLVFVRDRRKKDWLVLVSTNPELANEEIVRLYGRRWDIEVFFKMAKQHLKLVKEIQARDFDSLVAHTSIVFVRYQFPAYEQLIRTDNRTFGQLFYSVYEEMADIAFLESLLRILTMAIDKLRKAGEFSEKIYRKLIDVVMGQAVKLLGLESTNAKSAGKSHNLF
jgi:DNA-binding SARP family transcriptional activator